jgi:diguanylate cyclase (GGDEF)-like protein/PAS domain S-box-containing protein
MIDRYKLLYKQLFTNSSEAIVILDMKRNIVDANPLAEIMLCESTNKKIGIDSCHFSDFKTPEGQYSEKAAENYFKMAIQQGKVKFPWSILKSNGEVYYVDISISYLELEQEKLFFAQIENNSAERQNNKILKSNRMILEEIAQGVSLPVILDSICREVEALVNESICTVLSVDDDRKTMSLAAGPSVSDELSNFFEKLPLGPGNGSCGTAASSGEQEFVANTYSDPRWENIRDVAIQFGIKSCWSIPVLGYDGVPIGTIAISQLKEGNPVAFEENLLKSYSSLVGLAIQNDYRRKKMMEFGQQFRSIVNALPDLVFILSKQGVFKQIKGAEKNADLLKNNKQDIIGKSISELYPKQQAEIFMEAIENTLLTNESQIVEYKLRVPAGDIWFEGRTSILHNVNGDDDVMWIARDITQKKITEEAVKHFAYHDELTDLPNRKMCLDNISKAISYSKRHGLSGALMYVDIDNFKNINDEFGHHSGDQVLKGIAKRLSYCLRSEDSVSRFGGDEFLILISPSESDYDTLEKEIKVITSKIKKELSVPFLISNKNIISECSIGVSFYPMQSSDVAELIKFSDLAMYYSKTNGKNTMNIFDAETMMKIPKLQA